MQVGKVIWVAGHSGPETAEDSAPTSASSRPVSRNSSPTAT